MTKNIIITKDILPALFGSLDENLKFIEELLPTVRIASTPDGLSVTGDAKTCSHCLRLLEKLIELISVNEPLDKSRIRRVEQMLIDKKDDEIIPLSREGVAITARGRSIVCKTSGQRMYVDKIQKHALTLGLGPAGTGKTFLAVAMAATAYKKKQVERIVLTRPAIEAGERLGFLPGDMAQKVDPYLRPLFDALSEMFGFEAFTKLVERGIIEVAPLAYMRGRTLSNAFIILDEAQNTTIAQMKMFLTRMGSNSKVVVNGDATQVDLPDNQLSGLKHAAHILKDVEGIAIAALTDKDIVRHELVQRIVNAYEKR